MKIGIIIAIIFIALVFISGCEISDYLGFDLGNFSLEPEEGNVSGEINHPPVIKDIKLKK